MKPRLLMLEDGSLFLARSESESHVNGQVVSRMDGHVLDGAAAASTGTVALRSRRGVDPAATRTPTVAETLPALVAQAFAVREAVDLPQS